MVEVLDLQTKAKKLEKEYNLTYYEIFKDLCLREY